jgi:hypothetical protein
LLNINTGGEKSEKVTGGKRENFETGQSGEGVGVSKTQQLLAKLEAC